MLATPTFHLSLSMVSFEPHFLHTSPFVTMCLLESQISFLQLLHQMIAPNFCFVKSRFFPIDTHPLTILISDEVKLVKQQHLILHSDIERSRCAFR
jgi:hypothetical protein